jgi:RNA polymerase sigma-70 factor (ECF subfamily)
VRRLLHRYLRAWELADIDGFVRLVAEDVRFSMPPLTAWFEGRDAVAAFVENAIFAPARPHGVPLRASSCNGQAAFGTYEPDGHGRLIVSGLQILQLGLRDSEPLITALVSYRDPALAIRCGLPHELPLPGPARYSGMLPCFFGGRVWRLVRSPRRARVTSARVSAGRMTASR